jgi:uncharacterized protein (DUF362 family)
MSPAFRTVVAYRDPSLVYPENCPFDPGQSFPEYPFDASMVSCDNSVYGAVRELLYRCHLDAGRFGTADWNPFAALVKPGQTVLIKPNWVRHFHVAGEDLYSIITHPSVVRPLIDYAFKAVGPHGRIWVMDAPQFDADFEKIRQFCRLSELEEALQKRGVPLTIADLRSLVVRIDKGVVVERTYRTEWSCEGVELDLGADSELAELGDSLQQVFGSDYDRRVTAMYHHNRNNQPRHSYRISRRVLEADLVISVPKLKTHKKNGVTLNIKNMIGINTDKNYIPHYRVGSPAGGGDEFPDTRQPSKKFRRWIVRHSVDLFLGRMGKCGEKIVHLVMILLLSLRKSAGSRPTRKSADAVDIFYQTIQGDSYRTGNWWGNDTCWRTSLDINKLLFYGTVQGQISDTPQRAYFSVIDGITGGDEDGPMSPTPRHEGVLLAGFDPLSVDQIACQVMGFRPTLIRDIRRGLQLTKYPLTDVNAPIRVESNRAPWSPQIQPGSELLFRPHYAWVEYLQEALHDRV